MIHKYTGRWMMDVTRENISHILDLTKISCHSKLVSNLADAVVVCAILEGISGLEPSLVITEPRYLKLVAIQLLSICFHLRVDATGVDCHQFGLLGTDLHAVGCGGFVVSEDILARTETSVGWGKGRLFSTLHCHH